MCSQVNLKTSRKTQRHAVGVVCADIPALGILECRADELPGKSSLPNKSFERLVVLSSIERRVEALVIPTDVSQYVRRDSRLPTGL